VVFDVDSTLIEDEVIELLAEAAGKRAEVAAVTERAMRGELDFAESLRDRVATLVGLDEAVIGQTYERITVTAGAQELIDAVHAAGGKVGAVSGGFNQVLEPLAKRLSLDFWRANELGVANGKLSGEVIGRIVDRQAKADALAEWSQELGLTRRQTVAVGDGANDLQMMQEAGLSVAFNAKPTVREQAQLVVHEQNLAELVKVLGILLKQIGLPQKREPDSI
jgi:phosphoserine phosphatase